MTDFASKLDQMIAGTLDAAGFSHADHIGVAYEALLRHDFFVALGIVADGIQQAAGRAGADRKFNATVTLTFMSVIAERMAAKAFRDADEFIAANPDLLNGEAVLTRFSQSRLASETARRVALLPDLPQI